MLPMEALPGWVAESAGSGRLLVLTRDVAHKLHGGERLGRERLLLARRVVDAARPIRAEGRGPGRWLWDAEVDGRPWRLVAVEEDGRMLLVSLHPKGRVTPAGGPAPSA